MADPNDAGKKARTLSYKEIFNLRTHLGRDDVPDMKLGVYTMEAEKYEGGTHTFSRLMFERGHAVGVLGYDPVRDEVVIINEMRAGALVAGDDPYSDAVVAGCLEENEDPIEAARREWREETKGADELRDAVLVHKGAFASPGACSEKIAFVFGIVDASKAGGVAGLAEEAENIKTVVMPATEFIRHAVDGGFNDLKTSYAGCWFGLKREEIRAKYLPAPKAKAPAP
jgi:ADP-ribose pyrophosphatase